jgi:hypothetical protein
LRLKGCFTILLMRVRMQRPLDGLWLHHCNVVQGPDALVGVHAQPHARTAGNAEGAFAADSAVV